MKPKNLKEVQIHIPPTLADQVKGLLYGQGLNLKEGYRLILEEWVRNQKANQSSRA